MTPETEAVAAALEATGDYRVLRRLKPRAPADIGGKEPKTGVIVDVETTGLDPARDEVIEIAILPFFFSPDGIVAQIFEPWSRLRQPSKPIPPEITAITGIDDAAVAGRTIDPEEVAGVLAPAVIVIAHNAAFDRPFAESICPVFRKRAWACSSEEINWAAEGFEGRKLGYLATESGFFYDRHRAVEDCAAVMELLARPLPKAKVPALVKLLEAARQSTSRIWASGSPFETKDVLKSRSYRWNDGTDGRPKSWFVEVPEPKQTEEVDWLYREIFKRNVTLKIDRITAFTRYSGAKP
jgi:DNA polymerase-3 subunit epsilon